jgi:hypothetical protein
MNLADVITEAERLAGQDQLAQASGLYGQWLAQHGAGADANERFVAHYNRALLLLRLGDTEPALTSLFEAVQAAPQRADTHDALLTSCMQAGLPSLAIGHVLRTLLQPAEPLLRPVLQTRLQLLMQRQPDGCGVHWQLDGGMEASAAAACVSAHFLPKFNHPMAAAQRYAGHLRIRLGYLVRDPAQLPEPARRHDPGRFDVRVYCWDLPADAQPAGGPRGDVESCWGIAGLSDDAAAALIRVHEVDVLVDLHGLAAEGRPGVLVYHPAPVQLTWTDLGWSTGLRTEDGCVGQGGWTPPLGLPWLPAPAAEPAVRGAGLNWAVKAAASSIQPEMMAVLLRLLAARPDSQLLLLDAEPGLLKRLQTVASASGLMPERIRAQHGWNGVDVYLDCPSSRSARHLIDALALGIRGVAGPGPASGLLQALGLAPSCLAADLDGLQALALRAADASASPRPDPAAWRAAQSDAWLAWWEQRLQEAVAALPERPAAAVATAQELEQLPDLHAFTLPGPNGEPFRRRYVIAAPPHLHNSAGVRVLYDLQKWLVRAGYDAIIATYTQNYYTPQFLEDIVIYPETFPGNWLRAKRVVRFILNVPGKLGESSSCYDAGEFLVAYNRHLAPYADGRVLQVPSVEPWFYDPGEGAPRDVDVVYVGKGQNTGQHPPGCVEITRAWPPTRREVAELLRRSRTIYSYDHFTMLVAEAQLCGCRTMLIQPDGSHVPFEPERLVTPAEFRHQLHAFIAATQRL